MRVHLWNDRTRGTDRPRVQEDGTAEWWTHVAAGSEEVGDLVVVEPEGDRWRVVALDKPGVHLQALYGSSLRSVRARRDGA